MKKIVTVKIIIDEDAGVVSTSIAGLTPPSAITVIEQAYKEAEKLLEIRSHRRRFWRPLIYRSFGANGRLIMKHDKSGWTWGGDSSERGEPGAISFENARGRKAIVRIEVSP